MQLGIAEISNNWFQHVDCKEKINLNRVFHRSKWLSLQLNRPLRNTGITFAFCLGYIFMDVGEMSSLKRNLSKKQLPLSLISIHIFRLSLTQFLVKEKYLGRKINLPFLRVPAKPCRKRKLVWSSIILVLRIYCGLSSLRPDKAVGRPFCKKFFDPREVSTWFKKEVWLVSL